MMPKKMKSSSTTTSLKKPLQARDKPAIIQHTKQVPKPGKFGIEIDDIFGGRKKKKLELEIPENNETKAEIAKWNMKKKKSELEIPENKETKVEIAKWNMKKKKKKPELATPENKEIKAEIAKWKMKKRKRTELDDVFNNNVKRRPRKRTAEGFPVYTEAELCVNKPSAGDTPLCPFDCNCCF